MVRSETPLLPPTFWKLACGKGADGEFVRWKPLLLLSFGDMLLDSW